MGADEDLTRDTECDDEMVGLTRKDPNKRRRTEMYNNMMDRQITTIMEQMRDQ